MNPLQQIADNLSAVSGELSALRAFAQDVMEGWPEGAPDGGDLQELAVKHGLLVLTPTIAPCGENCGCAEYYDAGEEAECYRRTDLLTGDSPAVDDAVIKLTNWAGGGASFRALAERAVPFLRDEAEKYEDDGSNEPLELAREIESLLASAPSDESALPSADLAFDGGAEAAPPARGVVDEDIRWCEDIAASLQEAGGPTNNMRLIALHRLIESAQAAALPAVPDTWQERLRAEYAELDERFTKLCAFLESERFASLHEDDRRILMAQGNGMRVYLNALTFRVDQLDYAATPAHDQPEGSDNG